MKLPSYYENNRNFSELFADYEVALDILLGSKEECDLLKARLYWAKVWLRLSRREEAIQKLAREHFEHGDE
mgnify:CR=1 FL=1